MDLTHHIKQQYNNPEFSDFNIISNGTTLYVHKLILSQIPFFKSYFNSAFNKNNQYSTVNIEAATFIIKLLYGIETIENLNSSSLFIGVIELMQMWLIFDIYEEKLFARIGVNLDLWIEEDIKIIPLLYKFYGETTAVLKSYELQNLCFLCEVLVPKAPLVRIWTKTDMTHEMIQKVQKYLASLPFDVLQWNISILFSKELVQQILLFNITKYLEREFHRNTLTKEDVNKICAYTGDIRFIFKREYDAKFLRSVKNVKYYNEANLKNLEPNTLLIQLAVSEADRVDRLYSPLCFNTEYFQGDRDVYSFRPLTPFTIDDILYINEKEYHIASIFCKNKPVNEADTTHSCTIKLKEGAFKLSRYSYIYKISLME
jgi:hypothetical protein